MLIFATYDVVVGEEDGALLAGSSRNNGPRRDAWCRQQALAREKTRVSRLSTAPPPPLPSLSQASRRPSWPSAETVRPSSVCTCSQRFTFSTSRLAQGFVKRFRILSVLDDKIKLTVVNFSIVISLSF